MLRSEYGTFQLGGITGREGMGARILHYIIHVQPPGMCGVYSVYVYIYCICIYLIYMFVYVLQV